MNSLREIAGVGEKTIILLNKLNIFNINNLITYYPKKYNVMKRSNMNDIKHGDKVIYDGLVLGQPTIVHLSPKLKKVIFRIGTKSNIYNVCAYNQVFLCKELKYGMGITVIGKYDRVKNTIVASEIRKELLPDRIQIEPVYSLTDGLTNKALEKIIDNALEKGEEIVDYIPVCFRDKYKFPEKMWSIKQIHHPETALLYRKALQRLKYEELFFYLFRIQMMRDNFAEDASGVSKEFNEKILDEFIEKLEFKLTSDQLKAVYQIKDDLCSKKRMNRLVQGDVGCGKTIVAFLAGYMNYLSGYQTALMVPTEILANQHFLNAVDLFKGTDMKIELLTSSVKGKSKADIYEMISNGKVDFVIGTQSLIQEKLLFNKLGLIITDEQHRFGVNQRNVLMSKGVKLDVLSMSATPIPRTYALTIYGDTDISNIKTKPVGRKEIITYYMSEKKITSVLEMMKTELKKGHQIYVIAPSIDDNGTEEVSNVMKLKEKMHLAFGKIADVGAVYGRLEVGEKDKIMNKFEKGELQILISTTVVEVGVNVPNASMMVIFNANMFGLSTLHQLRGRVGRGDAQSYCILLSKDYCERLKVLEKTSDGFEISEYDFQTRGEGDLFGVRQSGDVNFKLSDIRRDYQMLVRAREDVLSFLHDDKDVFEKYKESVGSNL